MIPLRVYRLALSILHCDVIKRTITGVRLIRDMFSPGFWRDSGLQLKIDCFQAWDTLGHTSIADLKLLCT